MELAARVIEWINAALFVGLAVVAARQLRASRQAAAGWVAATFGVIGSISVIGLLLPEDVGQSGAGLWGVKLLILAIFAVPYMLYRFAVSFEPVGRRVEVMARGLTGLLAVLTLFIPRLPAPDEPRTAWIQVMGLLLLLQWTVLSTIVVHRLWRAGRAKPSVARMRMRSLSLAALVLNLNIALGTVMPSAADHAGVSLAKDLMTMASAVLFFWAFAPPRILRMAWRRPEEQDLREAQLQLMTTTTAAQVMDLVLPAAARVVGAGAAELVGPDGATVSAFGEAPADRDDPRHLALRIRLDAGELVLWSTPHAPYFGQEELELLRSFGSVIDLALARCVLLSEHRDHAAHLAEALDREKDARQAFERANADLEAFVYSVSHDLKSPIISLLGYLDYLKLDFGDDLPGDALRYIERMTASASYMQDLIQGVLELSRVGRVDALPVPIDVTDVMREVVAEVGSTHPALTVRVHAMPTLMLNGVRARQLLTNLVSNAAEHGRGAAVEVDVRSHVLSDGSVVIDVADDGPGIAEQYREKVFGVFERLEASASAGTGIGLSICRKIMESSGGTISVAATERGTCMRMVFPPAAVVREPAEPGIGAVR